MSDWQPIETAPRDGTKIDLWTNNSFGDERETNCWWGRPDKFNEYDKAEPEPVPGWCFEVDAQGMTHAASVEHKIFDRRTGNILSYRKVTHWMPLPSPPE